jgi:hypothetical protein
MNVAEILANAVKVVEKAQEWSDEQKLWLVRLQACRREGGVFKLPFDLVGLCAARTAVAQVKRLSDEFSAQRDISDHERVAIRLDVLILGCFFEALTRVPSAQCFVRHRARRPLGGRFSMI